ncbi:hypothetical protein LJB98_01795 [Bacteroidales bacterium OttesenSCG-928-M11]|nr:hypothetical protein [Bacteroidales bacterium OttesenSCG-928-M11]
MSSKARQINRKIKKNKIVELNNITYYPIKYFANRNDIEILLSQPTSQDANFLNLFPKKYHEIRLNKPRIFKSQDLQKEIQWQYFIVRKYSEPIKKYLERKNIFENNFFLGDYNEAMDVLNNIESEICISDWSTEMKILTAYHAKDYEDFKKYTINDLFAKIKKKTNEHLFAYLNSLRIEKELPIVRFEKEFKKVIDVFAEKSPHYVDYYYYKVNFHNHTMSYNDVKLLQIEDMSSIIDRYETLIFIIQSIFCKKMNNTISNEWLHVIIQNLYSFTNDKRLENLLLFTGKADCVKITEKDLEYCNLIDIYTNQNYNDSKQLAKQLLLKYPNLFDLYKIYALSCVYSNTALENVFFARNSIAHKALDNIYKVLSKSDELNESIAILRNLYTSLGKMSWAFKCCSFVYNETSLYTKEFKYRLFSILNDNILYPRIVRYIKSKEILRSIVDSHVFKINNNIKFLIYNQAKCLKFDDIVIDYVSCDSFRERIANAQVLKSLKKYKCANEIFDEITFNKSFETLLKIPHNEIKIVHGKMRCLVEMGEFNDAITLVTNYILKNRAYSTKLRYETLISAVINNPSSDIRGNVFSPIYLHLFKVDDIYQWGALANYMSANKIHSPHELSSISNENIENIKYVLRNVCTKNIIGSGATKYTSRQGLIEECIEVYNRLIQIDSENKKDYEEEIYRLEIDKNVISTQYRTSHGKLTVNIEGIKNDVKYLILKKKFNDLFNANYDKINDKKTQAVIFSQNFNRLFEDIRDIFVLNNDYGFDWYLGTRIRHGNMQNAIRTIFEEYNLITIIDSKTSKYLQNSAWDALSKEKKFQTIMSDFSSKIDNLITDLNKRILRVKIDKELPSDALFDFCFSDEELKKMCNKIIKTDNITFENFFDAIVDELWNRSNQNLKIAREFLLDNVINKINDFNINLQNELQKHYKKQQLFSLTESILSANTACQNKITNITKWFSIMKPDDNPFKLENLIEACHISFYKQIKLEVTLSNFKNLINGKYLNPFSDIFHILFNNVANHSGLSLEKINVNVHLKDEEGYLSILISNNLSNNIDIDKKNKEISSCLKNLDNLSIADTHSGLARIHKLITKDMDLQDAVIEIPKIMKNYKIEVSIKMKNTIYHENTNN